MLTMNNVGVIGAGTMGIGIAQVAVQKGKKVTQEILYIPPKESFKGGKEYLKGLKRWNKANNFGKKNKFASDLKYLQKLK